MLYEESVNDRMYADKARCVNQTPRSIEARGKTRTKPDAQGRGTAPQKPEALDWAALRQVAHLARTHTVWLRVAPVPTRIFLNTLHSIEGGWRERSLRCLHRIH